MPHVIRATVLLALLSSFATSAIAEPLLRDDVPEPLKPWIDWALSGHEQETCPHFAGGDTRSCVWPGRLELTLDASGGRFTQLFFVDVRSTVQLPGERHHWPERVTLDGESVPVVNRKGRPALVLEAGRHEVTGRFQWQKLPRVLRVPAATGLISLRLDGQAVPHARRDTEGRLWLGADSTRIAAAENRLSLQVHRRVMDQIPLRLTTDIQLHVSGESREARVGPVLPPGFVPLAVSSPLPSRLEPDGTLRLQVRPGRWRVRIQARREGPVAELLLPAVVGEWDDSEVWVFAAEPTLRLVDVEGAPPVDPSQTELPEEWKNLPAYEMKPGTTLRLVEKRRGSSGPLRDDLQLARTWHLDFDGKGATVSDSMTGTIRSAARLEMGPETTLGRAAVNGRDQPITRRAGGQALGGAGIEVPLGSLSVDADSRVEANIAHLPAVGWNQDVSGLKGSLQLPPGWRLLHASGVDRAQTTWIGRWTLLDLFVVTLVAMAFFRLFGLAICVLAATTLALTYTETGAPAFVWVFVLAFEGLRRVVPEGRFAMALTATRSLTLVLLLLIAVPFSLQQLRSGLFPALERPWAVTTGWDAEAEEDVADAVLAQSAPAMKSLGYVEKADKLKRGRPARSPSLGSDASESYVYSHTPDPKAQVPTGPGRPDWQWETVRLQWTGPVERGQQLRLWLLPPWANAALALLRTALLLTLVLVSLNTFRDLAARWWPGGPGSAAKSAGPSASLILVTAVAFGVAPTPAAADIPSDELLGEMRTRLLEKPVCHPHCASIPRLLLDASPSRLDLRMTVDAAARTAVPVPGGLDATKGFVPETILVNGRPAENLSRQSDGTLWLLLSKGSHLVQVRGALPQRETLELPLWMPPHRAEATLDGWELQGLHPDGRSESALQMRRLRDERKEVPERFEPTAIPPFVTVTRELILGLSWQTHTTVRRVAPAEGAVVVRVPLLAGEAVTTPGIRVNEGVALATLRPGQNEIRWTSVLPITAEVELTAPDGAPWTEVWRVDPSPVWHVEPGGIPWVESANQGATRRREWRPWPGEQVILAVERPAGVEGSTVTIDSSQLVVRPGIRATDANLTLRLRSSQGGRHEVQLPEGAELLALELNGRDQPLRQEGREVPLPLSPGTQTAELTWREPVGIGVVTRTPEIDLGIPSVNHHSEMHLPDNRWALATGGATLGPAVLFWPLLLLLAVLAVGLGRVSITPLRTHHWFLLGIGLSQAPISVSGFVVLWLLALGWRREAGRDIASPLLFDLQQIALVGLTLAAMVALIWSIQQGLLGTPEMQIAGNGSMAGLLRWYQDRVTALLPQTYVVSVSLWFYRLAMLAWALWVARSLIGWLSWGWECFSHGDLWRSVRKRNPTEPEPESEEPNPWA